MIVAQSMELPDLISDALFLQIKIRIITTVVLNV